MQDTARHDSARHDAALLDAIDAIARDDEPESIVARFTAATQRYGYNVAALGVVSFGVGRPWPAMFYLNTWPDDWFKLYQERDFVSADLLVKQARRRIAPFTWDDAIHAAPPQPREREVFEHALAFGWSRGFVAPIHGPDGYLALVSLAGGGAEVDSRARILLRALAHTTHDRLILLDAPFAPVFGGPALTRREIDCLASIAAGLTDEETGTRLGIATSTAHEHIERAKCKLNVKSRTQAAAMAVMRGLVTV